MNNNNNKKKYGQFFTTTNPFNNELFFKWFDLIKNKNDVEFIEPFSGSNNIVKMINDLGIKNKWHCFDIDNSNVNNFNKYEIKKCDTLKNFPKVANVAITNPPFLSKDSSTKSKIDFHDCNYDNLYKLSLDVMLSNCEFVAAIIPESFIVKKLFHNRLYAFISLKIKMFEDTEYPVCLALFIPENLKYDINLEKNDFLIYKDKNKSILFSEAKKDDIYCEFKDKNFKINTENGKILVYTLDTANTFIRFLKSEEIQKSTRHISKISFDNIDKYDLNVLIEKSNKILNDFRKKTDDLFLTSFRGLRKDNLYRRILNYKYIKIILSLAIKEIEEENNLNVN